MNIEEDNKYLTPKYLSDCYHTIIMELSDIFSEKEIYTHSDLIQALNYVQSMYGGKITTADNLLSVYDADKGCYNPAIEIDNAFCSETIKIYLFKKSDYDETQRGEIIDINHPFMIFESQSNDENYKQRVYFYSSERIINEEFIYMESDEFDIDSQSQSFLLYFNMNYYRDHFYKCIDMYECSCIYRNDLNNIGQINIGKIISWDTYKESINASILHNIYNIFKNIKNTGYLCDELNKSFKFKVAD